MKLTYLLLILLVACGKAPEKKLEITSASIFGGDNISENSKVKKYIVGVYDPINKYICTGTLISPHTVLTAAHCAFHAKDNKLEIVFDDQISTSKKNKMPVEKINIHSGFLMNEKIVINDLALLSFSASLPENYDYINIDSIQSLPNEFESDVIIAGMGHNFIKPFKMGAGTLRESLLTNQNIKIDYCIVGEPSSENKVGDTIKIGRRGSLNGKIVLHGKQGHVAYPHLAINPIHKIIPALNELVATVWDAGNEQFPPTSFQITQIKASGESSNVIPESIECHFNLRYSTQHTEQSIKEYILNCFHKYQLTPTIQWVLSGKPFLTASGKLLEKTINVIQNLTQQSPNLSTNGGTSDGRFIAPYNVEVIELGPVNKTIHQINECVLIEDLNVLVDLYLGVLQRL